MHVGSIPSRGLKHLIEVFVTAIKVGQVDGFLSIHNVADPLVAALARGIVIKEAVSLVMLADVGLGLAKVIDGVQYHYVAGGRFARLHHLPGQEIKEALENGDGFGTGGR